jgi:hypothetical protein
VRQAKGLPLNQIGLFCINLTHLTGYRSKVKTSDSHLQHETGGFFPDACVNEKGVQANTLFILFSVRSAF